MITDSIHHSILENMRDGVISLDLRGRITTFNAAAAEVLGLSPAQVIGKRLVEVFFEIDGSDELTQTFLDAVYESSVTHHRRIRFSTGPESRLLAVTTSFLFEPATDSSERQRIGVIAVFSDVTEVEQLRERARDLAALRVEQLVRAYRERGHVLAALDPLELAERRAHPELEPAHYGIDAAELDDDFTVLWGDAPVTRPLREILHELRRVYCGAVGVQTMHIDDLEIQGWLRGRLEGPDYSQPLPRAEQLRILEKLTDAEVFESFLQGHFKRAKRFSLEGAETLIPLLDQAIVKAAEQGVERLVMGMSHRGRLNVLCNILGRPASDIFRRFERFDSGDDEDSDGDVRFHLGAESRRTLADGREIQLSLCFNPSHLEFVGPVVLGRARAAQDDVQSEDGGDGAGRILPLIVHGDAAFAGQGIIQEQFNLSRLAGYATGGAVHIVLNNQIGFTTPPEQGRSTQYATDVARMLQIPIFHVNGEEPEAVDRVIRLALEFRRTWRRDVVIDMYCYRRHGHMELDEPGFTQPVLYRAIEARAPIHEAYTQNLLRLGQVSPGEAEAVAVRSHARLQSELSRTARADAANTENGNGPRGPDAPQQSDTAVPRGALVDFLGCLCELPEGFDPHPKIAALLRRRRAMIDGKQRVDWATGEALAYATLLAEGHPVRLTGQDSERGTFAHRHAVLHDAQTGATLVPLANLKAPASARFSIHNSPLTECATVGFEFGYSIEQRQGLVIWEAQFGDFANVAQVIIDQFLVSSQAKWNQPSGLVLFLPHGLEGQGPEHSSARPERFLQLCAKENIVVVHLSTAAQVFHRLRQQALSPVQRPLILFTPKRLLQHASAASTIDELCHGGFRQLIADTVTDRPSQILLCAGQVASDLQAERKKRASSETIVKLEQLYPFPREALRQVLATHADGTPLTWVQEEPENMGAWRWLRPQLSEVSRDHSLRYVARPERVSPATGSLAIHQREHRELMDFTFEGAAS